MRRPLSVRWLYKSGFAKRPTYSTSEGWWSGQETALCPHLTANPPPLDEAGSRARRSCEVVTGGVGVSNLRQRRDPVLLIRMFVPRFPATAFLICRPPTAATIIPSSRPARPHTLLHQSRTQASFDSRTDARCPAGCPSQEYTTFFFSSNFRILNIRLIFIL